MLQRIVLIITILLVVSASAYAVVPLPTEHALTTIGAMWTSPSGVIFEQGSVKGSGTGVFDPFVRIQANNIEQGYNTDYRPVQFDEKQQAGFTHALSYTDVPNIVINNTNYHEFKLDINETGGNGQFLSLDEIKIYETNDPNLHGYPTAWPTPIYDLGISDYLKLDSNLGSGLGASDMSMYVPDSFFSHNTDGSHVHPYLTLYSKFGVQIATDDGYEQWGVSGPGDPPIVPEPSGIVALLSGASALLGMIKRRR